MIDENQSERDNFLDSVLFADHTSKQLSFHLFSFSMDESLSFQLT